MESSLVVLGGKKEKKDFQIFINFTSVYFSKEDKNQQHQEQKNSF